MTKSRLSALRRNTKGIAALELAAAAPLLIFIFGAVTDFSMAIWSRTATVSAVEAGAAYVISTGQQSFTASTIGPYLTIVANRVAGASLPGAALQPSNVTVKYNNATDGSNLGKCYCLPASGTFPSSASACGSSCADGTTAGAFVQVSASFPYTPISPVDASFMATTFVDSVTVRVQ